MVVPKGSIVTIGDIQGILAEDTSIQLKSNFRALASEFQNEVTQAIDIAGSMTRSLSGGQIGFSSQFKQMTTQVWDKTDPARININVEFHRVPFSKNSGPQNVSGRNVMDIVRKICSIPLPAENKGGNLIPPGPSPFEGIGLDPVERGTAAIKAGGYVNVTIGNIKFHRILIESAEPTFSKYVDNSGYHISCRIALTLTSLWAATKSMVSGW